MCERPSGPVEGPAVPAWHEYLVREVATALVVIGGGAIYTEAAERVRGQAWGAQRQWNRKTSTSVSGGLVAEWLGQYGPTVAAAYREEEWPDTLVIDSTESHHTDSRTGIQSQLFCVLFAYGYPSDDINIMLGIRTHWYRGRGVQVHSCEHHLYLRARKNMEKDQVLKNSHYTRLSTWPFEVLPSGTTCATWYE